jgi:uncharacterized protein (TIGR02646 family)
MIRIERERTDASGVPIQPDAPWRQAADRATAQAISEGGRHRVNPGVYSNPHVRAVLEELFHDKCAYCETKIAGGAEWDVDHFRPKGSVAENASHPGYYWLAYTWRNLYPACKLCNQRRRDPPRWRDRRWGEAAGKLDHFPLEDEAERAFGPQDLIENERPLLIDPCRDQPETHLGVAVNGHLFSLGDRQRGVASIDLFHLNRKRLCDLRRRKIEEILDIQKLVKWCQEKGSPEMLQDLQRLAETMTADGKEYAATVRAVLRDPDAFGL